MQNSIMNEIHQNRNLLSFSNSNLLHIKNATVIFLKIMFVDSNGPPIRARRQPKNICSPGRLLRNAIFKNHLLDLFNITISGLSRSHSIYSVTSDEAHDFRNYFLITFWFFAILESMSHSSQSSPFMIYVSIDSSDIRDYYQSYL